MGQRAHRGSLKLLKDAGRALSGLDGAEKKRLLHPAGNRSFGNIETGHEKLSVDAGEFLWLPKTLSALKMQSFGSQGGLLDNSDYGERWHSVRFPGNVPHLSRSDVVSLQVLEKQSKKLLCAHVFDRSCGRRYPHLFAD